MIRHHVRLVALLFPLLAGAQPVRVLHLADLHLGTDQAVPVPGLLDLAPGLKQAMLGSPGDLDSFSEFLERAGKQAHPEFAVVSGDLVTASAFLGVDGKPVPGPLARLQQVSARSPIRLFFALGNHDLVLYNFAAARIGDVEDQSVAGQARAAWIRSLDCFQNGTFYHFQKQVGVTRYRFVILDNAYFGERLAGGQREFSFSGEQQYWLKKQVNQNPEDVLILVLHVPLDGGAAARSVLAAIAGRKKPALVLAGHTHAPDKVEPIAVEGQPVLLQVWTPAYYTAPSHWRLLRLHEDRIEIAVTGTPDKTAKVLALTP
ncbi:MAG: metallophosphoesterase [Acidobacteria bacterium]|nr:metallophosphoesterase [Acidobacteriota bacterium]